MDVIDHLRPLIQSVGGAFESARKGADSVPLIGGVLSTPFRTLRDLCGSIDTDLYTIGWRWDHLGWDISEYILASADRMFWFADRLRQGIGDRLLLWDAWMFAIADRLRQGIGDRLLLWDAWIESLLSRTMWRTADWILQQYSWLDSLSDKIRDRISSRLLIYAVFVDGLYDRLRYRIRDWLRSDPSFADWIKTLIQYSPFSLTWGLVDGIARLACKDVMDTAEYILDWIWDRKEYWT